MCALVLGLGVTSGGAAVATTTFTAAADAYISSTTNTSNGSQTTLKVKPTYPTETAYLKFNVSGLTGSVQSATLRVYANSGLAWGFDAYNTTSSWTETGLNYTNAPARTTKLGSFPSGNLTGWISLDVTPAVTGNGTYSFALVGTYWQEISLAARESGANAPQLIITSNGTPPPADTQPPTTPTNLTATSTTTTANLTWTAATDNTAVTGYNLYRDGTKVGTTTSTTYGYSGLTCGTGYTLGVEAYDAAGNTSTRSTLPQSTTACPDTQPPTVPANLTQTGSTTSSVTFGWVAATDNVGVTGYGTYLGATSKGTTTATTTTISGLVCGTSYTVGVDAADAAANRSARATLTATTASCPVDSQAPTAPANLATANPTGSSIGLSWSASTDDTAVTGYRLSRDGDEVGTTTGTSYSFAGLGCGTAYSFGVEAYDAAGNTSIRSTVTASTTACPDTQAPSVPANLAETGDTTASVTFAWDAATDNVAVTGYGTYLNTTSQGTTPVTNATISGLVCGTSYSVGVDAADASANRSAKATLTATTEACPIDTQAPTAPTNLAVSGATANSLTLSWTAATDDTAVTGYTLYRDASQAGTTSGSTSYTYGGLACGSSYTLGVEASDAVGHTSTRSTVVASTASCGPTSATFVDAADAYVSSSTNTNNGTATTLRVKQSNPTETAYLKFNVSGLTGSVQSATLRVYANSGLAWGFDAYNTTSSWTETGLNYTNAPARTTKLGSFPSGNLTGWISLDVTPAVTGNGTYSFALVGTYWQEISLAARESGANAPQLIITSNGTPPPADTQPPTTPTNLTATSTTTTANLTWTAATDNTAVTGYNLYRSTTAGFTPAPGNRIAQPTSTGYADTALAAGTYYYRVTARDAAGNESAPSAEASATATSGGRLHHADPGPGGQRRRRDRRARLRRGLGATGPAHERRHGLRDHVRRQPLPDRRQRCDQGLEGDWRAAGQSERADVLRRAGRRSASDIGRQRQLRLLVRRDVGVAQPRQSPRRRRDRPPRLHRRQERHRLLPDVLHGHEHVGPAHGDRDRRADQLGIRAGRVAARWR